MENFLAIFVLILVFENVALGQRNWENNFQKHSYRNFDARRQIKLNSRLGEQNCLHGICEGEHDGETLRTIQSLYASSEFQSYFGDVIKPRPKVRARFGTSQENMCTTIQRIVTPKSAKNTQNVERIIANDPSNEKRRQSIAYDYCDMDTASDNKCSEAYIKGGTNTQCTQQYSIIRMVTLMNGTHFELDHFPIPTSCVCTYAESSF